MKKSVYLLTLVGLLTLSGLIEAISGFVLWFALPSGGGRRGLELSYLGITRHTWITIHDWVAIVLTVVVVIHLLVHWKWVLRMTRLLLVRIKESFQTVQDRSLVK
jgi:hypothetical protein